MDATDRLYGLYCQYYERHEGCFQQLNDALALLDSAGVRVNKLGRDEFIDRLKVAGRNSDLRQSWLNRIVRGHQGGERLISEVLASLVESAAVERPHFLSKPTQRSVEDTQ
jgi:hypothetical protein